MLVGFNGSIHCNRWKGKRLISKLNLRGMVVRSRVQKPKLGVHDTYGRYFHILLWSFLVLSIIEFKFVCPPVKQGKEFGHLEYVKIEDKPKTRHSKCDLLNSIVVDKQAADAGGYQDDEGS